MRRRSCRRRRRTRRGGRGRGRSGTWRACGRAREGMRRSGRAGVRGDGDASVPRTISDRRGLFFVVRKVSARPSSSSVSLSERRTLWIQSAHLFRVIRCFLPCRADAVPRGSWEVAMRSADDASVSIGLLDSDGARHSTEPSTRDFDVPTDAPCPPAGFFTAIAASTSDSAMTPWDAARRPPPIRGAPLGRASDPTPRRRWRCPRTSPRAGHPPSRAQPRTPSIRASTSRDPNQGEPEVQCRGRG